MDQDPIKQLQSFFDERGKMLEKITSIHSVLGLAARRPAIRVGFAARSQSFA